MGLEYRIFVPRKNVEGDLKTEAKRILAAFAAHGRKSCLSPIGLDWSAVEARTDVYLVLDDAKLGLKLRGGKKGQWKLELKVLRRTKSGGVEVWVKTIRVKGINCSLVDPASDFGTCLSNLKPYAQKEGGQAAVDALVKLMDEKSHAPRAISVEKARMTMVLSGGTSLELADVKLSRTYGGARVGCTAGYLSIAVEGSVDRRAIEIIEKMYLQSAENEVVLGGYPGFLKDVLLCGGKTVGKELKATDGTTSPSTDER